MKYLRYTFLLVLLLLFAASCAWFWLLHTTSGARWALAQAASASGLNFQTIDGDFGGGLEVHRLSLANNSVDLTIELVTATIEVDLFPASLKVTTATASKVDVRLVESTANEKVDAEVGEILRSLVSPIPVFINEFHAEEIRVTRSGESQHVDTLLLVGLWHEEVRIERLDLSRPDFDVGLSGSIDLQHRNPWNAQAHIRLHRTLTGFSEVLPATISADGFPDNAEVDVTIGSFATIGGKAQWREEFKMVADVVLDGVDLNEVIDNWPSGFPISGKLNVSLDDEKIALTDSILEIGGTNAVIRVDANMDRTSDRIAGQVSWRNLRWPLPANEVLVRSDTGDIRLAGLLDEWTVNGSIAVSADGLETGTFVIDGRGTRESVEGNILDSQVFGGRAAGKVAYFWNDARPWSAVLDVTNLEVGSLLPEWPGRVSGHIDGRGTLEPFALQLKLEDIAGDIRGESLIADGGIDIRSNEFIAHTLNIEFGESRVALDGSLSKHEGLRFDAEIADVGIYVEELAGALRARGRASMTDTAASFELEASSSHFAVAKLEFTNVELQAQGTHITQELQLRADHLDTPIKVSLAGAFDNWQEPLESAWRGRVESLDIDLGDEHSMTLPSTSTIELSRQSALIQKFCMADMTGSSLCLDAAWSADGSYSVSSRMTSLPMNFIEHFVATSFIFDQSISGTFDWLHSASRTHGNGKLKFSAGQVTSGDDGTVLLRNGEGIVDFEVENGALLAGDLILPLPGIGEVAGNFSVLDVRAVADSGIAGSVAIDIMNLSALAPLSSLIDSASGRLLAQADLSGTLREPKVSANFEVSNASIAYLPLGLELDEINMSGQLDESLRADLAGTFRAGEGRGEIVSRADYSDVNKPGLQFKLKGDNLTLINVPDVFVAVNPDIDVLFNPETLTINGELLVPKALIKPTDLATSRVTESEDVVIVAGELPDVQEEVVAYTGLQYAGELSVALGDSVVVNLDLATARVTGSTTFRWQGTPIPIASGRYNIAGSIAAFGQVLKIEEGAVRFPNVPANRPLIRIIAEREIYGNTQVKRAGVLVDGPISRPTIEAFTEPMTSEERALTLLVTGSDFDYEQGVGAIDFGTYIAPRLFVSYGIGVFERENVLSARYDLNKGFGIKASSGSKEAGVDLNYRFEK
jgi:translocation and assembly module TamB